ncbi:MAG: FtsX-like permease family protein [Acidimicrobiales bacterium]
MAISLIVALGAGVYTGLGSMPQWRRANYDASYAALDSHDLLVTLSTGSTVPAGSLAAAVHAARHPDRFADVTERLVAPTQVKIERPGGDLLVPGRLVGVDLADGGPTTDRIDVAGGRALGEADRGEPAVILDRHFAETWDLPSSGTLALAGDRELRWVGTGMSPQYFMVVTDTNLLMGERGFAVLYASNETVGDLTGQAGRVDEAGVRLAPGAPPERARAELEDALAAALPDAAVTVTPLADERARGMMYRDIEGDQRLVTIFAVLLMVGAAFAAFTLTSRIIEAQRREIGIAMALGTPTATIALRPILVGAQIALGGVALGAAAGLGIGAWVSEINQGFFPMPVWETPFQPGTFARGVALGFVLTFVATLIPVVRAVRVRPVDAIVTRPRVGRRHGRRVQLGERLPGGSLVRLPARNVVRNLRRTVLTALAISAVIATLIGVIGMLDSFVATVDRGEAEVLATSPDRLAVDLSGFTTAADPTLGALAGIDGVAKVEPGLRVGGRLRADEGSLDVLVEVIDLDSDLWAPTAVEGRVASGDRGLVISSKAASDLGVGVGDRVRFRHPVREGTGYRWEESPIRVDGIHPNPYRFLAYLDLGAADLMNLDGIVNTAQVGLAPGADGDAVRHAVFETAGVASVQPVRAVVDAIRDAIDEAASVLDVVQVTVLVLAVLIAFNSTSIGSDERRREHATMFAFGVPLRTVVLELVVESALIGVVATAVGIGLGLGLLGWITGTLLPTTLPDLAVEPVVGVSTYVTAAVLGVVAVAVAPLLTVRRLRRMDLPSTLRVVE